MHTFFANFAASHEGGMRRLLEELVLMQTGTANTHGVDAMADYLAEWLEERGLHTRVEPRERVGNLLVVDTPASLAASHRVIYSGHMDTVFPADTDFNFLRIDGDIATGPGTCDMKGGLVTGIYAMLALLEAEKAGLMPAVPIRFLFSPDEETSSLSMRDRLRLEADQGAFALVFEMAGANGALVRTRKGKVTLGAHIRGKAGHAAFVTHDKVSAVLDAARKTVLLEALNTPSTVSGQDSLSVNVGCFCGGMAVNVVSEEAHLDVEARCNTVEQTRRVMAAMKDILLSPQVLGSKTDIALELTSPPLDNRSTEILYALAVESATVLGQPMGEDFRAGCSEASYLALNGLPVIDGLGPAGGNDHSATEFVRLSSLPERTALAADLTLRAWQTWQDGKLRKVAL